MPLTVHKIKFSVLCVLAVLLIPAIATASDYCDHAVPEFSNSKPVVVMETSAGEIQVQLDARKAPLSVANFLRYVDSGFYDGTQFHRVIKDFVIQGGGFTSDYQAKESCDPVVNESGNGLGNIPGSIAMARMGEPHSGNSQFYFNLTNNDQLNPNAERWGYAVFGQVISGMDVLTEIGGTTTGNLPQMAGHRDVPLTPVVLEKAYLKASKPAVKAAPAETQ